MLTLLTATGERPVAWAICERLMLAQDYVGTVRWVVVDDGATAQPVTFRRTGWQVQIVRPEPRWQPGQNTQSRNLLVGLAAIADTDRVVIIEDDDYYSPKWLTHISGALELAELAGETHARYYNVNTKRYQTHNNTQHASLCATALTGSAIARLRELCQQPRRFIDIDLWRDHPSRALTDSRLTVGIKGLPGRGGIGVGHGRHFGKPDDAAQSTLHQWLGTDAGIYASRPA